MKTKFKLLSIIICALLLLTTTLFSGCFLFGSDDEPKLFTRDATNNDVYIDLSEDFALSINYTIKKALSDGLTPYNLRHTFASICAESVKPDILDVWMGDSPERLVGKTYVHYRDKFMQNKMNTV